MTAGNIRDLMVPHIRRLNTYQGVIPVEAMAEQAGIPSEQIIRLNGNENPYNSSPRVAQVLGQYPHYNHYPDQDQTRLRKTLAEHLGVTPEQVVAGNGSDESIDLLMRMFLAPGDNVIIPAPTFGMYAFNAEVCGAEAVQVARRDDWELDVEGIKLAVTPRTKMIFLASPNNPTGNVAALDQILALLETGRLVVVDEAYYEFCGHTALPLLKDWPNLVVLRTFSKWAGLAGLRIGLGVMRPDIAQTMMSMKPPYNVSLAAELALLASLEDKEYLLEGVRRIVAERERMFRLLGEIPGVTPYPSQANFILFRVPERRGKEIFDKLCQRGIFLRYFGSVRLKDYIRASVGLPHETDRVAATLRELVEAKPRG